VVDQENAVGLRLFDTWAEAAHAHHDGVMRLLRMQLQDKLKYLHNHHGIKRAGLMAWSSIDSPAVLVADLVERSLADAAGDLGKVRDSDALAALCGKIRGEIGQVMQERARVLGEALVLYGKLAPRVYGDLAQRLPEVFEDISGQLEDMLYPGFVAELMPGRLTHYPRYLKALEERLVQLQQDPRRDAARMQLVQPWWQRYLGALEAGQAYDEALDRYRWLIEEYRVSLFAQRLKTAEKVSEKRLAEAWEVASS
jgi:ATP-dependent helicase HrpA